VLIEKLTGRQLGAPGREVGAATIDEGLAGAGATAR